MPRRIVESMDEVIVSLDGPPQIHDEIRRVPGAFESLAERRARAASTSRRSFPVSARCTVQAAQRRAPARDRAGCPRHRPALDLLPGGRPDFDRVQSAAWNGPPTASRPWRPNSRNWKARWKR